jgi:outer membrane protein TolC
LLSSSLTDAVRIALVQNSDLRLVGEDVQSARGVLKQATGAFDSKVSVGLGYQRAYLSSGANGAVNQAQFSQTFRTALASVLQVVQANPNTKFKRRSPTVSSPPRARIHHRDRQLQRSRQYPKETA